MSTIKHEPTTEELALAYIKLNCKKTYVTVTMAHPVVSGFKSIVSSLLKEADQKSPPVNVVMTECDDLNEAKKICDHAKQIGGEGFGAFVRAEGDNIGESDHANKVLCRIDHRDAADLSLLEQRQQFVDGRIFANGDDRVGHDVASEDFHGELRC